MPTPRPVIALALTAAATSATAQPPPDYGHSFVTITDTGNRNTIPSEVEFLPELQVGSVGYEYRIARTETTVAQWVVFANAYFTAFPERAGFDSELFGRSLSYLPGVGVYNLDPVSDPGAANMSWRMAARYCNWLHNDQRIDRSAFESGAYDTSTFTRNPDGTVNDQRDRSPGARYWIPSRNEWVKAAFYDPNRYGPGEGGYWRSPNGTNIPLRTGLPSEGGQTNAGQSFPELPYLLPVGAYADVQSPWGLWDLSGGYSEWTDTPLGFALHNRITLGTPVRDSLPMWIDVPDPLLLLAGITDDAAAGLRVASIVPVPATVLVFSAACAGVLIRKRRAGGPTTLHYTK